MLRSAIFFAGVALILPGCASGRIGGSDGTCVTCPTTVTIDAPPTATPVTAKVISITILPEIREMKVEQIVRFSEQIEMSPGIPGPGPPPIWITDNPAVAAVDSNKVTALAPGHVTLSVHFRGASASRLLNVIP